MKKNKALFFINSLKGGGAEKVVLNLAEELNNLNIKSVIVTLYKNSNIKLPNYIENICLNLDEPKNKYSNVKYINNINKIVKSNVKWNNFLSQYKLDDFCLVTAHLPMSHRLCMISPYRQKCIYVMHLSMSVVPKIFRPIHNLILNKNYKDLKISCVSNGIKKELIKIKTNNLQVIYDPINIKMSSNKTQLHNRPYMIIIGRLCKQKNQSKSIQLYEELNLKDKLDLIIIGDGPDKNKLKQIINNKRLQKYVHIKNYQENIADWISQSNFLISTSLYEGFSLVLAECLTLNVPVISTNCNYGPSEILCGNLSEYLIPINASTSVWDEKISKILKNQYPKIEKQNTEKFLPEKIVTEYLNYYEQ